MKVLEERILKDGIIINNDILKVDSFLNHQIDVALTRKLAKEIAETFKGFGVNKVLTIETSGLPVSYAGVQSTGRINLKKDFDMDIKDRTVVVVEDVVDTGISMKYLIDHLNENYQPKRIIICCMFDKEYARCEDIKIDYVGKVLKENCFLVGYGLDYNELERNVPYVFIAQPEDIDKWNEEIQK